MSLGGRILWFALFLAPAATWIALAQAPQPRKVDDAALKNAAQTGEEWITYNLGWSEQRFSRLDQINASNVNRLGLAWYSDIPAAPGNPQNRQEATPLVYNGAVYSITPWSVVYAVDARTGKELWRSDPEVNQQVWQSRICCGVVNRGIALYEDKIIAPVVDGRLRALDVATGKIAWETRVSPVNMPYTITMAPRVIKGGKVIVGVSGGEYGVRGYFDAYDAETGKQVWRFYTVPGDPSKPSSSPSWPIGPRPGAESGGRSAAGRLFGAASPMTQMRTLSMWERGNRVLGPLFIGARAIISAPIASSPCAAPPGNSSGITKQRPATIGTTIPSLISCSPISASAERRGTF